MDIDSPIQSHFEYSSQSDENRVLSTESSLKKGTFGSESDSLLLSLNKAKEQNETAFVRCVGLTIETKPDYCKMDHINLMLELGTTRIELGVQSLNDTVFKLINRGHTVQDVYRAFYEARNSGYKIGAHMMPGLPGSSYEQDLNDSKILFEDERLKPDMLKIYPTLVVRNTGLYKLYKEQKYKSYSTTELVELLVKIKKIIPPWVRIMRIQREIEAPDIVSGPKMGNIRQLVLEELKRQGVKCKCIRCREIGLNEKKIEFSKDDIRLFRTEYNASRGKEIFLSFELKDRMLLLGFLRLRMMSDPLRKELQTGLDTISRSKNNDTTDLKVESFTSAIVRELHVYGTVAKVGEQVAKRQHVSINTKSDIMFMNGDNSSDRIQSKFNPPASDGDGGLALNNQVKYQHKGLGRAY